MSQESIFLGFTLAEYFSSAVLVVVVALDTISQVDTKYQVDTKWLCEFVCVCLCQFICRCHCVLAFAVISSSSANASLIAKSEGWMAVALW